MSFRSTGGSGAAFLWRTGLIKEPYAPFTPDILLSDEAPFALDSYGVPGRIEPTFGHTRGSISVVLSDARALVGDLLASGIFIGGIARKSHARRPPFEDEPAAVARALERLLDAGVSEFHVGHGGPLAAEQVRRHVLTLRSTARGVPLLP